MTPCKASSHLVSHPDIFYTIQRKPSKVRLLVLKRDTQSIIAATCISSYQKGIKYGVIRLYTFIKEAILIHWENLTVCTVVWGLTETVIFTKETFDRHHTNITQTIQWRTYFILDSVRFTCAVPTHTWLSTFGNTIPTVSCQQTWNLEISRNQDKPPGNLVPNNRFLRNFFSEHLMEVSPRSIQTRVWGRLHCVHRQSTFLPLAHLRLF